MGRGGAKGPKDSKEVSFMDWIQIDTKRWGYDQCSGVKYIEILIKLNTFFLYFLRVDPIRIRFRIRIHTTGYDLWVGMGLGGGKGRKEVSFMVRIQIL